ncbi:MAG: hypothetical protein FWF59_02275 [Turicibacter sp.]|nr:hypothetical protein [Turicibacter sp.]
MKLEIKNREVLYAHDLLYGMSIGGVKSVHRTRICKLLAKKFKELQEEAKALEGAPMEELVAFEAEPFVIEGGNLQKSLQIIGSVLQDYEKELEGKDAEVFELLYSQLVKGEETYGQV